MRRNRGLLLAVGVFLAGCAAICAVVYILLRSFSFDFLKSGGCLGDEPYADQTIEQMGNFQIPNSTRNLNATSIAWQDCLVRVDFEMDASELDDFLASTYVPDPLTLTDTLMGFNQDDYAHWGLDHNKQYLYGGGSDGASEVQYIAIDTADPQNYKVYLISMLL